MNPKIKDYLGIVAIVGILLGALGFLKFTTAYSGSLDPGATFTAQGEARVSAVPDVAQFYFGIVTEGGKDIPKTQEENTKKTNAAIDYIKSAGVEAADITTENYQIEPRYESYSCPPVMYAPDSATRPSIAPQPCKNPQIIGYTVSQNVRVKVRDFAKIGDILSGVASRGANNVSGLSFTVHDMEKLRNEAKAKAMQQAKDHAKDMAKAGGFRLGKLVAVEEGGGYPPYPYNRNLGLESVGVADAKGAPAIEPGSQEITATVVLRYELR